MSIQLHKKHLLLLITAIVLIGLLYAAVYFIYLEPQKRGNEQLQTSINLAHQQLELSSQKEEKVIEPTINSVELQRKLPVSTLVEQFVLDLEQAEVVSNSVIQSVTFSEEGETIPLVETPSEDEKEENTVETSDASTTEVETKDPLPLALEGLKLLEVSLTVTSSNYYDLEAFIKQLENQTRITKVDELTFSGPPEIIELSQEIESLTYDLKLSAFYFPTLTDLDEETPTIDTPPPSLKQNPLTPYIKEKNDEDS
ncbi:hypothetical protein ACFFIX_01655 [Metabacillus herbersteinensis]|uniref:Pilus assembly protein PilO n=1 Tax=Metabacillus herbersteinensis TaxID=283816 RepID=A0ABV6G916_9BACI